MYARLRVAYDDGHRVLTSAAVLAEVLRGTSRDAGLHRVLARVAVEPSWATPTDPRLDAWLT